LPAFKNNKVALVLDVDSDKLNDFDNVDERYLHQVMTLVTKKLN
jgi:GAF domain-containing protein